GVRMSRNTSIRLWARSSRGHAHHHCRCHPRASGRRCQCDNCHVRPARREVVWTVNPGHPVARGVPEPFVIPEQEMYGEYFDIPQPDELVFISSFAGGEVFRSGCAFVRGQGRIFYFSPGHETHPVYHQPEVRLVIANAVRWAGVGPLEPYATYRTSTGRGGGRNVPTGWYLKAPSV